MKNELLITSRPSVPCKYRTALTVLALCLCQWLSAQNITVRGTVSADGDPLIGATVLVKGTTNGTITEIDGSYSIEVPTDAILLFSYVGYEPQEIAVGARTSIDVELNSSLVLDEVVVVGYGTMERANVTGSIVTVDVDELEKVPVPNVVEGLRAQVPGLRVTRGSGQPGSGITFKIRGTNSLGAAAGDIDATNTPIIVIDGVPIVGGNLAELNPDDIASINILKDAAAASIYGSSGANGAVLITTKSGIAGQSKISVSASTGFVDIANKIPMMNGGQYIQYRIDSEKAVGVTDPSINSLVDPSEVANYIAGKDVDWQDLLLRTGMQNRIGLSASGGNDKLRYYLNGDLYSEAGIITHSDYNRYSVRFNGDFSATDWLSIGARVQLSKSFADETANAITEFNQGGFAPFFPISTNTPLGDVYNSDGTYTKFIRDDRFQINPLHRYNESILDRNVTRSYINPYIKVKILDGLSYTLNTYAEDREEFYGRFWSSNYNDGDPSQAQIQESKGITYLVDNILSFDKQFGEHQINATAVYGFQEFDYQQSNTIAEKLPTDLLGYNAIGYAVDENIRYDWSRDDWGRVYLVGRLGYTYGDRYSVTLTMRRDGSSRFGPNNRWGNFPSASVAWNIHNESFFNRSGNFNFLKLRLSYGELGNDRFPTYYYRAGTNNVQVNAGTDPDTGEPILFNGFGLATNASNPDLKWESSKQVNVGLDLGLFDSRLNATIDLYQTNTTDLLLFESIIGVVNNGFTQYPSNVGETRSRGIDIGLRANLVRTQGFNWDISANWAKDVNEIVRLSSAEVDAEGNPINNPANGWFIGEDIRELYDYDVIGVWQLGEEDAASSFGNFVPGDPKIRDVDGDGIITPDDRTFLGNPTPSWYGGINNIFSYKGLELSVLIEAVQGVASVNNFIGGYTGRGNMLAINYWTPDNPSTEFPRIGAGGPMSGGLYTNAIKVQDASFVALRNVSLGYRLPSGLLAKLPISDVSVYVRGNNLKYWTDYDLAFSPESGVGSYPITRTWIFGTKITF
ncbi:MAG: TonB-dependent receptor [Lewinella sp.]|nr:TonB-dependent receptor [Lewinella sp.]